MKVILSGGEMAIFILMRKDSVLMIEQCILEFQFCIIIWIFLLQTFVMMSFSPHMSKK